MLMTVQPFGFAASHGAWVKVPWCRAGRWPAHTHTAYSCRASSCSTIICDRAPSPAPVQHFAGRRSNCQTPRAAGVRPSDAGIVVVEKAASGHWPEGD